MTRGLWQAAVLVLLLTACGSTPKRPVAGMAAAPASLPSASPATVIAAPAAKAGNNLCAPTRVHLDSDYTPGGLYAPGVADAGPAAPIDVSHVPEPVPRDEPRARQGNRSPYKVLGKSYRVLDSADGFSERGLASWYGTKFNGRATSSGELYDICQFTAAHKTLPLPSYVRVTNLDNGRSLVVRVNDRGPFHEGRVMDLSYAAAVRLGVDRAGTARVELQAIGADGRAAAPGRQKNVQAERQSDEPVALSRAAIADNSQAGGNRMVQVGSFGEQANARRLVSRLRDAGIANVDLDRASVSGINVWRVRVGPVAMEKLAQLLDRLRRLDLPNPRVFSE